MDYDLTDEAIASRTYSNLNKHTTEPYWRGSVFEDFAMIRSPRSRGAAGEKLVGDIFESHGHTVKRSRTSQYDRLIAGHKIEIKVSTTWDSTPDKFRWSQIRNQPYDRIVFCGINANELKLAWAEKSELEKYVFNDAHRQHAGKRGGLDIYWISGSIEDFHWMKPIGEF